MAPRHTFTAGNTTFTVNTRYQPLSGLGRYRLGSELTVAVGDKITGENRVIRKFSNVGKQHFEAKRCLREIRFLRHFKGHDNIAQICDIDVNFYSNGDFDEVYLIEAYCETDLRKIIRLECPLADNELRAFVHQILRGVNYIHSAGVVLQDLTPENILVSEEGAVKIGALGSPNRADNISDERIVNPYQPPELSLGYGDLSTAANVWSVGCIIAELATGRPAFGATNFKNHIREIFEHTGFPSASMLSAIDDPKVRDYVLSMGSIASVPLAERYKDIDPQLLDLLSEMLTLDVDGRISCKKALSHKYLDNVRTYADGFTCFPYKANLEEDVSSIPKVKAQLVRELRSFYALQYDDMMDISLPQLDFGQDFKSDSLNLPLRRQPSAGDSPNSRDEVNLSATKRSEKVQSPEPPATIGDAPIISGRKRGTDKLLFWPRLKSTLGRLTIHQSDARTSSFPNGLRRWPSPRQKGIFATSVDTRPPSLSLGVNNIGEDFGHIVRNSLEDSDTSFQRTPYSRRASSVAVFTSLLDVRGEKGHGKASQDTIDLTRELRKESNYPYTGGAFSDIWRCYWFRDSEDPGPEMVAVKAMRTNVMSDKVKEKKRFYRELGIWRRLDHKNVVPLYGIAYGFGLYPAMVCPWAPKGALSHYLQQYHRTLSRDGKFQLLDDVASGLEYLHKNNVTHGDLTGNNVLIFGDGRARLADFGMSTALKELWGPAYFTESARGCFRWAAPELFQSDDEGCMAYIGPACDVYSFGSIILQVLSGKVPYFYLDSDTQVLGMVVRGMNPERPKKPSIDDEEWDIIQWCWTRNITDRPEIGEVTEALKSLNEVNPVVKGELN
ncbi:kinase-like domain-containing protein [Scleroderma yunnanense]